MLAKLLGRYLKPYGWLLAGVLLFQFASALASLYLPSLNADIIDDGLAKGDTGYIWRTGSFMLAISLGQILASVIATFFAARLAMQIGRDIRNDVFDRVSGFSEREVTTFGPGSLITRNTNDVQQVQMLAMMSATFLVTAPLLAIGGIKVDSGDVQIGTLFAFMQYVMIVLSGVMMASFMTMMIPRAAVCAERIGEVLGAGTTLERPTAGVTGFPRLGAVELRGATFTYPGAEHPVLSGVSFHAEPGETVAIVGSTGAGKTTLVSLLPRLFDVTAGAVLVNGTDVREADLDALWKTIGLVPQRPFLFSGTVASNLRFGREDATDADLWHALEIAQGRDFVAQMEGGLDARIAQGGTNVSGGQRQRLAIARAIVHRPAILVFDDSFSALDLTTDARLRQALWRELPEVTKIVVAQRISTITDADRIAVLEDGALVGLGTHDELLETSQTYREIVESQLGAEVGR